MRHRSVPARHHLRSRVGIEGLPPMPWPNLKLMAEADARTDGFLTGTRRTGPGEHQPGPVATSRRSRKVPTRTSARLSSQ